MSAPIANDAQTQHFPQPVQTLQLLRTLAAGSWVGTDADNTLWAGDVGDELVRFAATKPQWWQSEQVRLDWYLDEMEHGDYHSACCHAAAVWALLDPAHQEAARAELTQWLVQRVRPRRWLVDGLQQAEAQGVEIVVISASPRVAVEALASSYGLGHWPVLALQASRTPDGVVLQQPISVGEGKVAAWQTSGRRPPALGLGDSRWDLPLLHSASRGHLLCRAVEDPLVDVSAADVLAGG